MQHGCNQNKRHTALRNCAHCDCPKTRMAAGPAGAPASMNTSGLACAPTDLFRRSASPPAPGYKAITPNTCSWMCSIRKTKSTPSFNQNILQPATGRHYRDHLRQQNHRSINIRHRRRSATARLYKASTYPGLVPASAATHKSRARGHRSTMVGFRSLDVPVPLCRQPDAYASHACIRGKSTPPLAKTRNAI